MIYGGIRGHVFAIDPSSGEERWRTKLSTGFLFNAAYAGDVMVLVSDGMVIAGCNGHMWGLRADDGAVLWHNGLSGLGNGAVTMAAPGVAVHYVHRVTSGSTSNP